MKRKKYTHPILFLKSGVTLKQTEEHGILENLIKSLPTCKNGEKHYNTYYLNTVLNTENYFVGLQKTVQKFLPYVYTVISFLEQKISY